MRIWEAAYSTRDGAALAATIFRPMTQGRVGVLLDIHGGTWTRNDRHANQPVDRALVEAGQVAVVAIEFHQGPGAYGRSLRDIEDAITWVRGNAVAWNIDPERVGLIGSSSGGHLALLTALGNVARPAVDITCVIALWPIVALQRVLRYAQDRAAEGEDFYTQSSADLVAWQLDFFGSTETIVEADLMTVVDQTPIATPPLLIVQSAADRRHQLTDTQSFMDAYRRRGGLADLRVYDTSASAFVRSDPRSAASLAAMKDITTFTRRFLGS